MVMTSQQQQRQPAWKHFRRLPGHNVVHETAQPSSQQQRQQQQQRMTRTRRVRGSGSDDDDEQHVAFIDPPSMVEAAAKRAKAHCGSEDHQCRMPHRASTPVTSPTLMSCCWLLPRVVLCSGVLCVLRCDRYCDQLLSRDLDALVVQLLIKLKFFQDRQRVENPVKVLTHLFAVCFTLIACSHSLYAG